MKLIQIFNRCFQTYTHTQSWKLKKKSLFSFSFLSFYLPVFLFASTFLTAVGVDVALWCFVNWDFGWILFLSRNFFKASSLFVTIGPFGHAIRVFFSEGGGFVWIWAREISFFSAILIAALFDFLTFFESHKTWLCSISPRVFWLPL